MYKHNRIKTACILLIVASIICIVFKITNLFSILATLNTGFEEFEENFYNSFEEASGGMDPTDLGIDLPLIYNIIMYTIIGGCALGCAFAIVSLVLSIKSLPIHKMEDDELIDNQRILKLTKSFSIVALVLSFGITSLSLISTILFIVGIVMISKELSSTALNVKYAKMYSDNKPEYKETVEEKSDFAELNKSYEESHDNYVEVDREAIYEKLANLERQYKNHDIDEDYYKSQKEDLLNQIK